MSFENGLFRFFIIWYICGVILLTFDLLPAWLEWANAVFLILSGLLAIVYFTKVFGKKAAYVISLVIFLFSYLAEYIGSTHGILFGDYYYTNRFAPNLFEVPIAIGFAWLMVMGTSHALANAISAKKWMQPIIGACIAVVIDLIIDPVAFKLKQYWIWQEDGVYYNIPFSNFLGWFIVALILHVFILSFSQEKNSLWEKRMFYLFALTITMFVLLAATGELWLACILTACLAGMTLYTAIGRKPS
ncbi:carotenoid biosynthesis protein [Niallia circulans]|uniref:Carotenoid biosynthesis protein n=1 Tax=Niallia circulans TaxID=1397 RepID=A0A553SRX0_NIACI|nr:carotenoid biosynthesis protein [Niallia circulans]TRZ39726.1 carotenoid biosynthesis protein [Niallia circulans]